MKAKVMMYLIVVAAIMLATTQPPQVGYSQQERTTSIQTDAEVQKLLKTLDAKNEELKEVINNQKHKPKVVYRTKIVRTPPKEITVYTRVDGEVTEHKVKNDNGFYVLDMEPQTETITETYYIDTCIHETKKKSLWKRLFSQQ